jgi:hypothetical protein
VLASISGIQRHKSHRLCLHQINDNRVGKEKGPGAGAFSTGAVLCFPTSAGTLVGGRLRMFLLIPAFWDWYTRMTRLAMMLSTGLSTAEFS